jgi:hypothetical protein
VHPRVGLDDVEKKKFLTLQGVELRPLGYPAAILTALSRLFIRLLLVFLNKDSRLKTGTRKSKRNSLKALLHLFTMIYEGQIL